MEEFGKLMFGEWDDNEWCQFDNYMIECLQMYLAEGLVKSFTINLKLRKLVSETCEEFAEWSGALSGNTHHLLKPGGRVKKQDLYYDFIEDNPDFAPKSKKTVSRTKFNKWLLEFAWFRYGTEATQGRDSVGRWIQFNEKPKEIQKELSAEELKEKDWEDFLDELNQE